MPDLKKLEEYDAEPVKYCAKCYSLKILYEESYNMEFCGNCGCSEIHECSIEEWERKYERKYGHKYVVKSNDMRNSLIFQMSPKELMDKVSSSPYWEVIIRNVYPNFPNGLSRVESIILFFDMLTKNNQLDDLRTILYTMRF